MYLLSREKRGTGNVTSGVATAGTGGVKTRAAMEPLWKTPIQLGLEISPNFFGWFPERGVVVREGGGGGGGDIFSTVLPAISRLGQIYRYIYFFNGSEAKYKKYIYISTHSQNKQDCSPLGSMDEDGEAKLVSPCPWRPLGFSFFGGDPLPPHLFFVFKK
ncbi:hypothetical protein FKM82_027636 [Ascaphus truei]